MYMGVVPKSRYIPQLAHVCEVISAINGTLLNIAFHGTFNFLKKYKIKNLMGVIFTYTRAEIA